jgi:predicted phosphodiesterase
MTRMAYHTQKIKTRILIISDTHSVKPKPENASDDPPSDDEYIVPANIHNDTTGFKDPLPTADVALHCGDLTTNGRTSEFRATFQMMRAIRAPLKLVIAGNHDRMLDDEFYNKHKRQDVRYNRPEMFRIIKDAEADGVKYLTEGNYTFDLENGARLTIYASPYTPVYGVWAFQYDEVHNFEIPRHVDVAMTHGPPKDIFDLCRDGTRAGCQQLLEVVRQARPRIHCFGHIHEGWGAMLAKWNDHSKQWDDVEEATDGASSKVVLTLANQAGQVADAKGQPLSKEKRDELNEQRGVVVDTTEGEYALKTGQQTLFVNAAIMDRRYHPTQYPWIIDIDLDRTPTPGHEADEGADIKVDAKVQKSGGGFSMTWLK